MRKIVICLALASMAASCKKIPQGGNKNALKMEEGTARYSDATEHRTVIAPVIDTSKPAANTAVTINGTDTTATAVSASPAPHGTVESTVNTTSAPVNNSTAEHK